MSTRQIYLGGIPFVIIQLLLVFTVLFAPEIFMQAGVQAPVMNAEDAMKALDSLNIDVNPGGNVGIPTIDLSIPGAN